MNDELEELKRKIREALEEIGIPRMMISGERSIEILRKIYAEVKQHP